MKRWPRLRSGPGRVEILPEAMSRLLTSGPIGVKILYMTTEQTTVEVNGRHFPTETVRMCDLNEGDVVVTNGPAVGCTWQTENRVATVRRVGFVGDKTTGFVWTSDNHHTPDEFDDFETFAVHTCPTGSFTRTGWVRVTGPVPC